MEEGAKLTVEIKNSVPVELADLTVSFMALAAQYQRFVGREDLELETDAKLYIKEIRAGSIVADLISYAATHPEGISAGLKTSVAVVDFAKFLKKTYDDLRDLKKPDAHLSDKDVRDLAKILDPTSRDRGGSINIHAEQNAKVQVTINLNSLEANAIQNQAVRELESRREPEQKLYNKVEMYWHVASRGKPRKTTDKAVIERISEKPLPVYVEDDEIKAKMVAGKENPFLIAFIVDVELITLRGVLKGYRILHLYETIEDEPDE